MIVKVWVKKTEKITPRAIPKELQEQSQETLAALPKQVYISLVTWADEAINILAWNLRLLS